MVASYERSAHAWDRFEIRRPPSSVYRARTSYQRSPPVTVIDIENVPSARVVTRRVPRSTLRSLTSYTGTVRFAMKS